MSSINPNLPHIEQSLVTPAQISPNQARARGVLFDRCGAPTDTFINEEMGRLSSVMPEKMQQSSAKRNVLEQAVYVAKEGVKSAKETSSWLGGTSIIKEGLSFMRAIWDAEGVSPWLLLGVLANCVTLPIGLALAVPTAALGAIFGSVLAMFDTVKPNLESFQKVLDELPKAYDFAHEIIKKSAEKAPKDFAPQTPDDSYNPDNIQRYRRQMHYVKDIGGAKAAFKAYNNQVMNQLKKLAESLEDPKDREQALKLLKDSPAMGEVNKHIKEINDIKIGVQVLNSRELRIAANQDRIDYYNRPEATPYRPYSF